MKKLAEKNPSARSLQALAETYRQLRQYGMAADALKRALILNPPNAVEIKHSLAETLVAAGRYAEAIQTYQELAADDPNDFEAYLSISQIYIRQRDFVKASEASDKARKIDPSNLKVRYNDVKDALHKIETTGYGVCEVCGEKIEEDRLEANPAARTCKAHMNTKRKE